MDKKEQYLNELGYKYHIEKNYDKAIECFQKALYSSSQSGCDIILYTNLACNLYQRGKNNDKIEAEKYFEKAAKGDDPMANFYLGRIYENRNNILCIDFYTAAARQNQPQAIEWCKTNFPHTLELSYTPYDQPPYSKILQ